MGEPDRNLADPGPAPFLPVSLPMPNFSSARHIGKVATLVSRVLHPPTSKVTEIEDTGDARTDVDVHVDAAQAREAELLYQTLENWANRTADAAGPFHERVRAGNCVYQHAAQVSVVLVRCLFACPCRWSLLACFGRWSSDQGCSALALLARSLGSCLGLRLGGWSDDWVTG